MLDTDLAARLRRDGLVVREISGWKTRGDSFFNPRGAVTHHTAGAHHRPGVVTAPSLGICINGRSDLPGPLCNTYIDFEKNVYVIAAGRANHAGLPDLGRPSWMTGNSSAWGLEVEHPGTFPLPEDVAVVAARVQAATVRGTSDASRVVFHKEWAPSRKIDLATWPSPNEHRALVAKFLADPSGGDQGDDEMQAWVIPGALWFVLDRDPATRPAGMPVAAFDNADFKAIVEFFEKAHKLAGPPETFLTWNPWYVLDRNPATRPPGVPDPVPNFTHSTWWRGMNAMLAFAKAYAEKADDPLETLLAQRLGEIANLQERIATLEEQLANDPDDSVIAELQAERARVKLLLDQAVAELQV